MDMTADLVVTEPSPIIFRPRELHSCDAPTRSQHTDYCLAFGVAVDLRDGQDAARGTVWRCPECGTNWVADYSARWFVQWRVESRVERWARKWRSRISNEPKG